jgi:hypothetical protein
MEMKRKLTPDYRLASLRDARQIRLRLPTFVAAAFLSLRDSSAQQEVQGGGPQSYGSPSFKRKKRFGVSIGPIRVRGTVVGG